MLQQVDPLSLVESDNGRADDGYGADDGGRYANHGRYSNDTDHQTNRPSASSITPPLPRFELPRCVSGKLPGGLRYVRATLPPNVETPKIHGGAESDGEGGASDDGGGGRDAGGEGEGGAVKSFATGEIVIGGADLDAAEGGGKPDDAARGGDSGIGSGSGDYFLVRVDSLDRVCDVIYCGFGDVEAKNLSKIVGVQLGYLQVIPATWYSTCMYSQFEWRLSRPAAVRCVERLPRLMAHAWGVAPGFLKSVCFITRGNDAPVAVERWTGGRVGRGTHIPNRGSVYHILQQ